MNSYDVSFPDFRNEITRRRGQYYGLLIVGIISTVYHMWFAYTYGIVMDLHLVIHLWTMMCMAVLFVFDPEVTPADGWLSVLDNYVVLPIEFVLASVTSVFMFTNFNRLYRDALGIYTDFDVLVGAILIVLVLDLSRRTFGWVITSVGLLGILYASTASYWPGILNTRSIPLTSLVASLTVQFTGLYDLIVRVSATYIIIFLLFAGFLESYGALEYFVRIGARLGQKFKSGVTQTAVIASLGMGSVNGSASANAATTGAMTIPLMKSQGIKDDTAAAIESVASSGGQIMPPIMGAAAFLMAEIIGTNYLRIITIGLLPALLFYGTVVVAVYLLSDKENALVDDIDRAALIRRESDLGKSVREKLDDVSIGTSSQPELANINAEIQGEGKPIHVTIFEGFYLWAPVAVLVYTLVVLRYNALYAGFWSTLAAIAAAFIQLMVLGDGYVEPFKRFLADTADGMRLGSQNAAAIAMAAAVMGLFVEVLSMTGFTVVLTQQMVSIASGQLWILLPLAMIAAILFGLGMPTTGAYLVAVLLIAPSLVELGVRIEVAHFFVLYFAILSALTPPVAIANIITSEISGASFARTCYKSILIGLPLFILPYVFVANPSILYWAFPNSVYLFGMLLLASIALSSAAINHFFGPISLPARAVLVVSAIAVMFFPVIPETAGNALLLQAAATALILVVLAIQFVIHTDRLGALGLDPSSR